MKTWLNVSKNSLVKKCAFKFLSFMFSFVVVFLLFCTFFTKVLSGLTLKFYKSENKFSLPFHFLNYFFCFLLKAQNCIKNMCKLCNTTIYPPWDPLFKNYFFQKLFLSPSEMLDLLKRWQLKAIDEKNHGLFNENRLQIILHGKMNLNLIFAYISTL